MSPEILTMIGGVGNAVLAFWLAFRKEQGWSRRLAVALTLGFALIAGVGAIEDFYHKRSMATIDGEFERKWRVLQETYVEAVEFEMMSPDGVARLDNLLQYAQSIRLHIDGGGLPFAGERRAQGTVEFSRIFTLNNLAHSGRLGIGAANVRVSDDRKSIEEFNAVNCLASPFITRTATSGKSNSLSVCSASVVVPLKPNAMKLGSLAPVARISLTITKPKPVTCIGVCESGAVLSVRLILRSVGDIFPPMIEVSPSLYLQEPSLTSQREDEVRFELSGAAVMELAKSRFRDSFGYRDREKFIVTMGALHSLYRWLTLRREVAKGQTEIVWTTEASPAADSLKHAIAPEKRASTWVVQTSEWCGFGERRFCWYRFAMFEPSGE